MASAWETNPERWLKLGALLYRIAYNILRNFILDLHL